MVRDVRIAIYVTTNLEGQVNTTISGEGSEGILFDSRNGIHNGFEASACIS
jgi:hypothetical protein